jgi:prepilin-type N-terminal cleavage/methylation domain-containing protein
MRAFRKLNQRGDTIVEVLISIAIVSLILGGAYVTTNTSLKAERGSQERTNATKLIESQLESMKSIAVSNPNSLFVSNPNASSFCVLPNQQLASANSANSICKFSASGANNNTAQPSYFISAKLVQSGGINTVTITNTWAAVETGSINDKITMSYRLYQ